MFDTLMAREAEFGIRLVGTEALNALRIDKAYIHWGTDLAYTESPHQVGLDFICKPDKPIPFIGRDAYLKRKAEAAGPFLCAIKLDDPQPLLFGREPILKDGKVVGSVYSAAYSQTLGCASGLCMLKPAAGQTRASLTEGKYTVLVEGKEVPATVSLRGFYDPKSERLLS